MWFSNIVCNYNTVLKYIYAPHSAMNRTSEEASSSSKRVKIEEDEDEWLQVGEGIIN
jgi:hypothetical protein